jgi:drug/metabolite transporter (DMT)-like permease
MTDEAGSKATARQGNRSGVRTYGPELAVLAVILLWSSTYTMTKEVFEEFRPLAFTAVRFFLIILLAWGVLIVRARHDLRTWLRIDRADLPVLVGLGLLGYTAYQIGFTLGLANTSPFSASLMIAMTPLVSLVIVYFQGERPPSVVWIGMIVSLTGVALFLLSNDADSRLLGNIIAFGGAVSFAFYQTMGRSLVMKYRAETYAAYTTIFGGIPLILFSLPETLDQDWSAIGATSWLVLLYMSVFPVYIAYMLWGWAISQRGVAVTGWNLLVPVLSGIISVIVTGESFGPLKILGAALALGGLLFTRLPTMFGRRRGTIED